MATAYLIGGAPRVGKTQLALRVVQHRPMLAVSADSVRDMLQGVLKPAASPALFKLYEMTRNESAIAKFLQKYPQRGVNLQNDESSIVWPSVKRMIQSHMADGQDILVEGVEILPDYLDDVDFDYKVVFLGNTTQMHANTIAKRAHANDHDWMHAYTDETIDSWAGLVRAFSEYIRTEAHDHGMRFVETHDRNFDASMAEAERVLLG